jgi:hypothetical protein
MDMQVFRNIIRCDSPKDDKDLKGSGKKVSKCTEIYLDTSQYNVVLLAFFTSYNASNSSKTRREI